MISVFIIPDPLGGSLAEKMDEGRKSAQAGLQASPSTKYLRIRKKFSDRMVTRLLVLLKLLEK